MEEKIRNMKITKIIIHILVLFCILILGELFTFLFSNIVLSKLKFMAEYLKVINISIQCLMTIIITFYLYKLYTIKILKAQMIDFRIDKIHFSFCDICCSALLPCGVIISFSTIGLFIFNKNLTIEEIFMIIVIALSFGLKAGILEEILFRGYMMKFLEAKWNKYIAIVAPSFIFSLAHIFSMNEITFSSVLLLISAGTLVGIMFSVVAYKNNSIWGSVLMHTLWNTIMISNIIHIFNGEVLSEHSIFSILLKTDNLLLTGGNFGIESSIFAILGYVIIILIIVRKPININLYKKR